MPITTSERTDTLNASSAPAWASIIQLSSNLTPFYKSKNQTTLMEEHGQRTENRQALALKKDLKWLLPGMNSKQPVRKIQAYIIQHTFHSTSFPVAFFFCDWSPRT